MLQQLEPFQPTAPDGSYSQVQSAMSSSLPILIELSDLIGSLEKSSIDTEVKKRRQRLGGIATSEADTRRAVEREVLPRSRLPLIWRAILDHPDAAPRDDLRRETERKLFDHLYSLLKALPSQFEREMDLSTEAKANGDPSLKDRVRADLEALANDLVLLAIPVREAWSVTLEGSDAFCQFQDEQWRRIAAFGDTFPESARPLSSIQVLTSTVAVIRSQRLCAHSERICSGKGLRQKPRRLPNRNKNALLRMCCNRQTTLSLCVLIQVRAN